MTGYLHNQVLSINFEILIISEQAFPSLFCAQDQKCTQHFFGLKYKY